MREKISTCITARNEEDKIRRCLESVKWTDEIVVVDSFSTDATVRICREYTDRVYQHKWLGYVGQKNLIKNMARYPWVLFLDADEEVSPELRDEILRELESPGAVEKAGYAFPRMVHYLGRWIRRGDWYPDVKLRLFRKDAGRCTGVEPHDRVDVTGTVKRLRGRLLHYTHDSIDDHIVSINKYSSITALGWFRQGKRTSMIHLIVRPPFRFIRCYLLKLGFLDGVPGLIVATTAAYGVFIKYAKLWALRKAQGSRAPAGSGGPAASPPSGPAA